MNSFFQVVGRSPLMVDHPDGTTVNHKPGSVFEARPDNAAIVRAVRIHTVRELSDREVGALRAAKAATAVSTTPGLVTPAPKVPATKATPVPTKPKSGSQSQ